MSQKRTVLGALEYSIETLTILKKEMLDYGSDKSAMAWAIGGMIATLVSNLLQVADAVFIEAAKSGESNAVEDMQEIRARFNAFIDRMIENA